MSRNGLRLPSPLFVDDVVFFAKASVEQAQVVKNCLDMFCRMSGQKVSSAKSSVFFRPIRPSFDREYLQRIGNAAHRGPGMLLRGPYDTQEGES